jgi:hypothetical protein
MEEEDVSREADVVGMVELELGDGVVVLATWDALTSMIEYPVLVIVAAGGVIVTRIVRTVPDNWTVWVEIM